MKDYLDSALRSGSQQLIRQDVTANLDRLQESFGILSSNVALIPTHSVSLGFDTEARHNSNRISLGV
jgi:hypothetical protein